MTLEQKTWSWSTKGARGFFLSVVMELGILHPKECYIAHVAAVSYKTKLPARFTEMAL